MPWGGTYVDVGRDGKRGPMLSDKSSFMVERTLDSTKIRKAEGEGRAWLLLWSGASGRAA